MLDQVYGVLWMDWADGACKLVSGRLQEVLGGVLDDGSEQSSLGIRGPEGGENGDWGVVTMEREDMVHRYGITETGDNNGKASAVQSRSSARSRPVSHCVRQ